MEIRTDLNAVYLSRGKIIESIMHEAKIIGLPLGAAKQYAEQVATAVEIWGNRRSAITQHDLDRQIAKELKKYNADLSFIFQNRGKII